MKLAICFPLAVLPFFLPCYSVRAQDPPAEETITVDQSQSLITADQELRTLQKQIREMHATGKGGTSEFSEMLSTYQKKFDQKARGIAASAEQKRVSSPPNQSSKPSLSTGSSRAHQAAMLARIEYFQELNRIRDAASRGESSSEAVEAWIAKNAGRFETLNKLVIEAAEEARSFAQTQRRPKSIAEPSRNIPPKMHALAEAQRSIHAEIAQAEVQHPDASSKERSDAITEIQKRNFPVLDQLRHEADEEARAMAKAPKGKE